MPDLFEWSSRQKGFSPTDARRLCTTSSAAFFSETNSTLRPSARLWAIRFVIVWDLPVPGGPCRTNDFPIAEYSTAAS